MKRESDFVTKIVVSLIIFTFLAAYFLIRNGYTLTSQLFWLDINIAITALLYLFFQYRYSVRVKRFTKDLSLELWKVAQNTADKQFRYVSADPALAEVYEALTNVLNNQRKNEETRQELLGVVNSIAGNMEFEKMLEDLMPKLVAISKSNCCAFYLLNQASNKLQVKYSLGFSKNIYSEFDMALGEGFFGSDFVSNEIKIFNDVPEDTLYVMRTFLGKIKPKSIMVVPITTQGQLTGALLFASIYDYTPDMKEMVELTRYYVGVAVGNGIAYEKTKRLANELKFQNKLIQNLNEDLEAKVSERILFLNTIIDSIQDYVIYAMDRNGVILAWNKGAELLLGYSADEVIGKNVETIYSEEEIRSGRIKKRIETVLRNGKYAETGWRVKKDGSKYYSDFLISAMYDQKGDIIGMTTVSRDITNLKAVEDALTIEKEFTQKILDSSKRVLLLTDDKGVIQTANYGAEKLLGTEQLLGRELFEFFENGSEFKENLIHTIKIASHGEWTYKIHTSEEAVRIHVDALSGEWDIRKLFVHIYK